MDELRFTSISHQLELDSVCLSLSSGALVLVHTETHEVTEVGSVDGGITEVQWSPDGDVLAMITGSGNLLVMNLEWEALAEVALEADGEGTHARITWRGDGKFFATGFKSMAGTRYDPLCPIHFFPS